MAAGAAQPVVAVEVAATVAEGGVPAETGGAGGGGGTGIINNESCAARVGITNQECSLKLTGFISYVRSSEKRPVVGKYGGGSVRPALVERVSLDVARLAAVAACPQGADGLRVP